MAKPLPVAAVVLPIASRWSVILRTSGGWCDISAMPPALSEIGPEASIVMVTPAVASMPTAAMAMPYWPAVWKATKIATTITSIGTAQLSSPTARPVMMLVAGPVLEA